MRLIIVKITSNYTYSTNIYIKYVSFEKNVKKNKILIKWFSLSGLNSQFPTEYQFLGSDSVSS